MYRKSKADKAQLCLPGQRADGQPAWAAGRLHGRAGRRLFASAARRSGMLARLKRRALSVGPDKADDTAVLRRGVRGAGRRRRTSRKTSNSHQRSALNPALLCTAATAPSADAQTDR